MIWEIITIVLRIVIGFGSGLVIAGGVIAFITIIGAIPIMTHRLNVPHAALPIETAIWLGAIAGSVLSIWQVSIPLGQFVAAAFLFAFGIFVGVLIIALAEVLDVMPIMNRRVHVRKGITLFVYALALGKLLGSFYYWLYPIFLEVVN